MPCQQWKSMIARQEAARRPSRQRMFTRAGLGGEGPATVAAVALAASCTVGPCAACAAGLPGP